MRDNIDEIDLISLKIIEKNAINKSVREANERKEDLARVLHRVENIYGEFEKPLPFNREFSTFFIGNKKAGNGTNIEMVEDVPTLEQMLTSHQSREKYLQQVTVFIVGYSKVAQDRLRLIQEVNQFFLSTEDIFDSYIAREEKLLSTETEDVVVDKSDNQTMAFDEDEPDYTISELSESMQQSIDTCQSLTNRLGELNNEMIECFAKYAQNKTGNKGKKKVDKALENAVLETNKLNEKLSQTSKIITEKDSRIDSLMKQCEAKTKEVQKYKAAAESIRKAAMESDKLREQLKERDIRIMKLEAELMQTQMKVEEVKTLDASQRANVEVMAKEFQDKSLHLEKTLELQKIEFEESKRELKRQHSAQITQLRAEFEDKTNQTKSIHEKEKQQLKSSEFDENVVALQWSEPENDIDRPLTKSLSSISKNNQDIVTERKSPESKNPSRIGSSSNKVESRQHTTHGSDRSSGKDVWIFDDAPDLDEEDFWSNIPRSHLLGRFAQYRQMSRVARSNYQDEIESANHATTRQIHSLKSQHQAHKHRWDDEREMLIEALRKVEDERKEIQLYADTALDEMEKFLAFMKTEDNNKASTVDLNNLNMLEIAEFIRDYLKQQNLMNDPISSMITTLIAKCQNFQERTRLSLPRFSTTIGNQRDRGSKKEMTEKNSQTDVITKTDDELLDENRDILLAEESDDGETTTRDVAVSASPSLLRIALQDHYNIPTKNTEKSDNLITAKDLEVPSNFDDVQDQTGLGLIQHPIVVDYLQSYDHILTFKEHFLTLIEDIDKTELCDTVGLRELKPVSIRSEHKIIPQIEDMGKSIEQILYKSEESIQKILLPRKKNASRSKVIKDEKVDQSLVQKGKQIIINRTKQSPTVLFSYIGGECYEMRMQIKAMKQSFAIKFNVINNTMGKMSQLLAILMKQIIKVNNEDKENNKLIEKVENITKTDSISNNVPNYDSLSILFTRKDSERNIRRMQQAILQNKMEDAVYEEAVERMANYVEIPAKRLIVLVKKYMYKASMQKIAEYVKCHNEFDADTFKILDKMEEANGKKIQRYDQIQEYFRNERIIRAQAMIETFDKVQSNSSIFLIRPVLSLSSRQMLDQLTSSTEMVTETHRLKETYLTYTRATKIMHVVPTLLKTISKNLKEETEYGHRKMWRSDYAINEQNDNPLKLIESKLFEIDTNRMLLPLNNVSTPYNSMDILDGQPMLPPNVAVRSYVAVAHPTLIDVNMSSSLNGSLIRRATAPDSASKSRLSKDLSKHAPLPPITPLHQDSNILTINDDIVDYI